MTEYKDVRTVSFKPLKTIEKDNVQETMITCKSHIGTHIDAPAHFLENGKTIDQIILPIVNGVCRVVDCTACVDRITIDDIQKIAPQKNEIILLKTRNSFCEPTDAFNYNFIYLDAQAAQYCVKQKIKAIGIDYLGIERNQPQHETHTQLLKHDIAIIEGLRLAPVKAGAYFLCCLPLYCVGLDAAPARAVLFENFSDTTIS